ncbi:MAG: glycosyltransferase [Candidatus Acidiferrales bacterium]
MTLKTLHLTNSWHETSGGIATFYRALIDEGNRRGHSIRLVVPGESDRIEEMGPFAKIYHVKARRAPFNSRYRTIFPDQFLPGGSALQKIVIAERPDIVEICDKYTLMYFGALLRRGLLPELHFRPIVIGLSCERMEDNFRSYLARVPFARAFCAAYMKWLYFPFFDHHIANSAYTAEELRIASRGHLIRRNVWIRPMGVDTRHLSPARRSPDARRRIVSLCAGGPDSVLLLYAGRLVPEKNLPLLFQVLVCLVQGGRRDYRLIVAGDGIERKQWEEFCRRRVPGHAAFLSHIKDRNEFADLLANADAFIHPNPREPFGIAPLEAMASGLPLVAPNSGGVASYAGPANAWLAPADVESFAAAVEDLLADGAARTSRVEEALRTAAQYRWDTVAPAFLDLYAELHSAAMNRDAALPLAAFSSTPIEGLRLAWFRGVSQSAEKMFMLASALLSRPAAVPRDSRKSCPENQEG